MIIQKMTENAWSVLMVGVFGAVLFVGKWVLVWGFLCFFSGAGGGLWYCCEWHSRHKAEWGWKKRCLSQPSLSLPQQGVGAACCGGGVCGAPAGSPHGSPRPCCLPSWPDLPARPLTPAAGRGLAAAAACPTFQGMQNQTASCSHVLRAGTAALLVFTLQLVAWPFEKAVSAAVKHWQ